MAYKVIKTFKHRNTGRLWRAGSEFDGTEAQARELARKGFVAVEGEPAAEPAGGLGGMTVKELRELCADLGVDAPRKAAKAELAALVESARAGSPEPRGGDGEAPEGE